jgi:hypothetical protein
MFKNFLIQHINSMIAIGVTFAVGLLLTGDITEVFAGTRGR